MCLHCGDVYVPALPISMDMFLSACKLFSRSHRGCKAPAVLFDADVLLGRSDVKHLINKGA